MHLLCALAVYKISVEQIRLIRVVLFLVFAKRKLYQKGNIQKSILHHHIICVENICLQMESTINLEINLKNLFLDAV